jgi:chaperonin GroEL
VINVGAATEVEMKEKKARVEDAMHATRAAREEGIVPGGGVALVRARKALEGASLNNEQMFGVRLLRRACEEPLRQIAENAGEEGSVVLDKVLNNQGAYGYNAQTQVFEDLEKAGVIDPTKVVRTALENASSVASLLLTTEALVAERPKKESAAPAGGGGHAHGGMGDMDF